LCPTVSPRRRGNWRRRRSTTGARRNPSRSPPLDDQIEEVRSAFEGATVEREGEAGLDSEGTGIGTYLVESLVAGYGGEAWIEDDDPGGTVFIIELPKADATGPNPTPF